MSEKKEEFNKHNYSADSIQALEGMEHVRMRPSMYIGDVGVRGLHHLVYEVVDNSIDEALAGHCDNITVTINEDNSITTEDDGRGIPVDLHKKEGISALEVVMTKIGAGGKFDKDSYKVSGGLHGVGVSCVNALSEHLTATVYRDGKIWEQEYERGKSLYPVKAIGDTDKRGTTVTFKPDATIFTQTLEYNYDTLASRMRELAYLNKGITIHLVDKRFTKEDGSFEGETLFKKPLKTGENIMVMANSPQGLIYITSEDANIVNLKTGEQVWDKPLKYKNSASVASTFDADNNRYLIAADGTIFSIDANSGDTQNFAKVKFDEKEDANQMEMRNGNIYLASSQNMMVLDKDGNEVYHKYYKSPSKSGFMKALSGVVAVASTALTMAHSYQAGLNKTRYGSANNLDNYNDYGKENKRAADMFASIADESFKIMSKRFKATAATENSQFILTKLDDGVGLVKVNKDNGNVDKEIILKDKKPEYQVDEVAGVLFYKANKSTIYAYKL